MKHLYESASRHIKRASPPGNGGRGLKRIWLRSNQPELGIAPRQRGAWIETIHGSGSNGAPSRIAPRQRGAWIETNVVNARS